MWRGSDVGKVGDGKESVQEKKSRGGEECFIGKESPNVC